MLKFICDASDFNIVSSWFIDELAWGIKTNKVQTLAADYWDDNINEKLMGLIRKTKNGFIFDEEDLIGEEPYGFVDDFFENHLHIIERLKEEFPSVGIDGYVFVNENGVYDCVLRQGVYSTPEMNEVQFIDQLQCICCNEWVNASEAAVLLSDGDVEIPMSEDGEFLYPSAYSNSGLDAAFCICSEDCKEDILEGVSPEFARELALFFEQHSMD